MCVCARASLPTSLPLHGLLQVTALLTDALLHGAFGQAKRAKGGHGEAPLPPPNEAVAEEKTSWRHGENGQTAGMTKKLNVCRAASFERFTRVS